MQHRIRTEPCERQVKHRTLDNLVAVAAARAAQAVPNEPQVRTVVGHATVQAGQIDSLERGIVVVFAEELVVLLNEGHAAQRCAARLAPEHQE